MERITKEQIEAKGTDYAIEFSEKSETEYLAVYRAYCQGFAQGLKFFNEDTEKRESKFVCHSCGYDRFFTGKSGKTRTCAKCYSQTNLRSERY